MCRLKYRSVVSMFLMFLLILSTLVVLPNTVKATPVGSNPKYLVLCTIADMWDFSDSCIQDLADAGVDMVELKVCANDPVSHPNPGGDGVMTSKNVYNYTLMDNQIARWANKGIKVILEPCWNGSLRSDWYPECYADYVNESGGTITGKCNIHLSAFRDTYNSFIQNVVAHYNSNSNVYGFYLEGPSFYGETELITDDFSNPKFYSYDTAAKSMFQSYLQTVYASLAALNNAWGTSYATWSAVVPPNPDYTLQDNQVDTRQSWSDFVTWRHKLLYDTMNTWDSTAKANTTKPVGIMIGGDKTGGAKAAPFSSSVGDMIKMVGSGGLYDDTGAENIASLKYSATVGNKYNVEVRSENDGDIPSVSVNARREATADFLMSGVDSTHYSYVASLFRGFDWVTHRWTGDFSKTEEYWQLKSQTQIAHNYKVGYTASDVAFFHSYYTPWYRGSILNNSDVCRVYDEEMSHPVYQAFASWGRYLTCPDVVDEQMILDDILNNYKVLVIPNFYSTVTLDTVGAKIKNWVNSGGYLVTFGQGSLTYQVNSSSRTVTCPDANNPANWCLGISGGTDAATTTSTTWKISSSKPSWLTSFSTNEQGNIPMIDKVFTSLATGAVPVVEDGIGNKLVVQYPYGSGKVLFCTARVDNNSFFRDIMPKIISDFADSKSIKRNVKFDPSIAVNYCGTNSVNGKKLFVAYSEKNLISAYDEAGKVEQKLDFDSSLSGNAELLLIGSKYYTNTLNATIGTRDTYYDSTGITFTLPNSINLSRSISPLPVLSVIASSRDSRYPEANMIDGIVGQNEEDGFWVSDVVMPQGVTLCLGKQRVVNSLVVKPRVSYGPKDVVVSVSNDNINFTNVWSGQLPNGNQVIYFDSPRSVTYVHLQINSSYSTNAQIRELEVYGPEAVDFSRKVNAASVTYSTQNASYPVSYAYDGNESTCWRSTATPTQLSPQYLLYDLGSAYNINKVEVASSAGNGPKDFDILVSADGINYSNVYASTKNDNKGELYTFNPISARYVKLNIRSSYASGYVAVSEMEAYATGADAGALKEIRATTVRASSSLNPWPGAYNAGNTLDGCYTSDSTGFWVSNYAASATKPEWLVYDLGKKQKISRVVVKPRAPYGNCNTEILVSTDGARYSSVWSGTAAQNGNLTANFTATDAVFVKILMKSSYSSSNVQIQEVEFFGPSEVNTQNKLDISSLSATSEQSPYYASYMKDGIYDNNSGFWVGNTPSETSPQVVTSDLGSSKTVTRVLIDSRMGAYAIGPGEVIIFASNDGTNYSEISRGYCSQGREIFNVDTVTARYIKIYIKSSYTTGNVQINELEVFGS